jgi:hypothetical protein
MGSEPGLTVFEWPEKNMCRQDSNVETNVLDGINKMKGMY